MTGFPRRFGSYVLLRPLARGGMGALYLALSGTQETAKLCVIKTVLPHLADKEYLARFRDEAKVVVRLSHGNLVPVFDSGQVEGEIYLAMDFVEGRDLRNTWNRCAKKGIAFPIDVAAHIVKELARGLHYAHTFGDIKLVHRDVSPPNVLLSYSGEVRLTDFGLAASTLKLEKTAPGIIYGKVSYMSPEQARGEPLDARTDLYAAGIILWELLTGRQVFPSTKPGPNGQDAPADELLNRVRNPVVVAPSKKASRVPAELDRIAGKALAPELKDRYANCEELRQDLAAYLAQTAPATDAVRVSKFLRDLYDEDIESERREREEQMKEALEAFADGGAARAARSPPPRPPAAAVPVPPPLPGKAPPPRPPVANKLTSPPAPTAPTMPAAKAEGEVEARRERGTVVAGPGRHDNRLNKKTMDPSSPSEPASLSSSLLQSEGNAAGKSSSVVGSVIGGRYQVRRLSGEGGMGRVYEAEHIDIGKRVALKILHPAYSQTPDLVERLRREARAASKISHPNVVDVTDSGTTDDGAFFFVMEYIEGKELGEIIFREKRLDVARALLITAQVCRALQAAHDVSVIHRDLKPENVLILSRDGQKDFVKVLDFGIAKSPEREDKNGQGQSSRRLTHPGMTMGTPEYMAPEQAAGKPADPRSDIYAVGGILYEMLTGNPPYEGSNFMEILHKKANQSPAPLSALRADVPPEIEALIMRALAKDPAERPQTMVELEQEIQRLLTVYFPMQPRTERDLGPLRTPRPLNVDAPAPALSLAGLAARVRTWDRKKVTIVAAGGTVGLALAFTVVFGAGHAKHRPDTSAASQTAMAAAPSPAVSAAAEPLPAVAAPDPAIAAAKDEAKKAQAAEADRDKDKEATVAKDEGDSPRAATSRATRGPSAADNRKLLDEGERLLRAERFVEAGEIFTKLTKSRRDKAAALVGLAEIAFQEKHYGDAVRSAQLAADRGGGVRARVLLGDAHFRLNQYKEAARAYEDALKLDPGNASARSGLVLANKRM
ncbi:MAG TPA: protein kinase [Polyangia bacterium]|nr:protein kinase [Polyangia bacterium]